MKSLLVVGVAGLALILSGCTDEPVKPDSTCYKSQRGQERIGTDGREYECSRDGVFSNLRWRLDD